MTSLAVVLIILGCAAYQYFKGTFISAFATIIIAICASVAAFGFFEVLANVFIGRGDNSRILSLVPWAQTLCFALLFIIVFGALQTGMMFLTRQPVDLGFLPESIGRVVCGIFLGLLLSGFLLTALGMAPLSNKYPYQRFDGKRSKVLLNADGFATGLFSIISKGSLSGKRSFATIHPDFLDQVHLNRLISGTSTLTSSTPAISLPKQAVWPAPESLSEQVGQIVSQLNRQGKLKDESTGKSISMPGPVSSDYQPTIVRVGIIQRAVSNTKANINGGAFILPQLRLICKQKGYGDDPLAGTGINIYPIGHLKAADEIQVSTEIKIDRNDDFKDGAREKFIDFVFCIPRDFVPVLLEFKQNSIVEIPTRAIVTADQAPPPVFFTQSSRSE
ncbi:MAG TPA: hypothetical protein VMW72_04810 [Sedimentisphaerales bacterium]|nr:hypothetical protein [Sedimentisphaerales bacterium]